MEEKEGPYVVHLHDIHIDSDYISWIGELKSRFRSSQVKAAVKVNSEKLLWNWQLGRDLVMRKAEQRWGSGVVEQVSLDLQAEFPEADGFSTSNLWYMKRWYLFYTHNCENSILDQFGKELQLSENKTITKLDQLGQEIEDTILNGTPFPEVFAFVPWRHHIEIIKKCKSIDEAFFYIRETINGSLSRSALMNCIKADMFHTRAKAVTNFSDTLPQIQSKLAQEITKENYDFGFVSLPKEYDETMLEDALEQNITRFLLELGTGFAFVGRQKEIVVAGKSRKIDMLFYHFRIKAYIVVELKAKPFEPEFAGKLNFYVNAVDELLKTDEDNPTIGLLICSDMNKTEVQWAFKGINTPMGVSSYNNVQIAEMKKFLPTEEQLQKRISFLEEEIRSSKK